MKSTSRLCLLFLIVSLLISSPAIAQTAAQPADLAVLSDGQDKYSLGRHLEILRDPSGELTFQDVTSAAYQDQFTVSEVEAPNFGFQKAAYWVRFRVLNQTAETRNWVLELTFPNMQYLDIYLPAGDGAGYQVRQTGSLRPFKSRDIPFYHLAFYLDLSPGNEQTIYMRFQTGGAMTIPLILWSQRAFTSHMIFDLLALGSLYGALLIIMLYNILVFLVVWQRSHLYLALFILSMIGTFFFFDGLVYALNEFTSSQAATSTFYIIQGSSMFLMLFFFNDFLELRTRSPYLHYITMFLGGAALLAVLAVPFVDYIIVSSTQMGIGLISSIFLIIVSLYYWRENVRSARFLFFSWIWFLVGAIFLTSTRLSILPNIPVTNGLIRYGCLWTAVFSSLALADRVNILKVDAEATSRQLRESETRLAQFLEAMPVGVVVYGSDLKPRYINQETQRLLTDPSGGFYPDLSLQRSLEETHDYFSFRITGTEQPYPLEHLPVVRAVRDGQPASAEDVEISLGDKRIPIESWASPLFDPSGEVSGAVVAFRDIQERLQKEALLRRSEARFRKLIETMNEGLGVLNDEGTYTYVNPRLAEMLGYSQDEMIGHAWSEFFDQENRTIVAEQLARRRAGEERPYTVSWRRKDGGDLDTQVAPAAIFDEAGKFIHSIAVITDISEQVKARQLLDQHVAERTLELETLLDVSKVVVSTLDLEPLLQVILEELKSVVDFEGAAIYSIGDHHLSTLKFPLLVEKEKAILLAQPLIQEIGRDERVMRTEAFMIADIQSETEDARYFRRMGADFLDFNSGKMHSWMGIPLKFKDQLIGVLSVHHSQVDYYTPKDARLAFAFANQAAVAIENARLYRKAQAVATAEERSRLARELHDSVTQALYSLTLYAGATRAALQAGKLQVAEKNLDEVVAVAREGMRDLRLLIFELRPPVLDQEGLVGALQTRLESVEARVGVHTELHVEGDPDLSTEMETELYWSLHEALNNVLKHAQANNVSLEMHFQNGRANITLRDDGVGFDVSILEHSTGIGLKNIADRIKELGGSFKVESDPGQGTVFEINMGE